MNNINLRAEVAVQITKEDLDVILFEALNAGGIAGWADRVMAVGNILGKRVCEQVSNGGEIAIRGTDGTWYELDKEKLIAVVIGPDRDGGGQLASAAGSAAQRHGGAQQQTDGRTKDSFHYLISPIPTKRLTEKRRVLLFLK